jgi:hypothetical protein
MSASCVFSCGNASRALREAGLDTVDISPTGELLAGKWWNAARIRQTWPDRLDATSGHLPMPLMLEVARAFRGHLGNLWTGTYQVPTGSGETLVCLSMAYPNTLFMPVYDLDEATAYNAEAPLNDMVEH